MKKSFWKTAAGLSPGLALLLWVVLLATGCQTKNPKFSPVPRDVFGGEPATGAATNSEIPTASDAPTNTGTLAASAATTTSGTQTNAGGLAALLQEGDRFAIGDLVTVKFSGTIEQISPHEERIKDDGTITLPLIGSVQAAGKTAGELQKEIHDRYVPDYYKRLTVIVTGEQRVYYVGGQVRAPGRQVYLGTTTVLKAIQSAGDFNDFAAKTRVELTRADGKQAKINCEKAAKDASLDLPVYPGDKINVPQRDLRDIFR